VSLAGRLAERIRSAGPLSVAEYMHLCLHDPRDGYYAVRPAIRADGDFITAPMVSQIFGELIGLWMIEVWRQMGRPDPVRLVELGPGDGTLMSDLLRAARLEPGFAAAIDLWLVEPSRPLRVQQVQTLGILAHHVDRLDEVPKGAPLLVIANEVLDCLPTRQWERREGSWHERRVGLAGDQLVFGLAPAPGLEGAPETAPDGAVFEHSPAQEALASELGAWIASEGGAALLVDYGRGTPGLGDTLQAVSGHRRVDPLERPGQVDLTVHADFPSVLAAARREGVETQGPMTQGDFLRVLGLEARARTLSLAQPESGDRIRRQVERLSGADQMGDLFLAVALHSPGLRPPGFGSQT